eukprot:10018621-Prorocentrum_lima.AAC.1
MTSSLVGSEMCNKRQLHCEAVLRGAVLSEVGEIPPSAPSEARAHSPVSYTHLTMPTICSV